MARLRNEEIYMMMTGLVSRRGTCIRRQVGCVLTNVRNQVLSTGYNGVASGMPHCIDNPCSGSKSESGKDLDNCKAIHAEQNALLQCRNVYEIDTCYVSCSPCLTCVKLLMNTSCRRIMYAIEYPNFVEVQTLWCSGQRYIISFKDWLCTEFGAAQ